MLLSILVREYHQFAQNLFPPFPRSYPHQNLAGLRSLFSTLPRNGVHNAIELKNLPIPFPSRD
ncbi:hypothetical protein [Nostoc sp. UHCC 0251]|uniref:hypothetical protein n=1 Tax=Nostoc sp. UHCC 0251 TaxID=3110240 RepID=UPI002B1F2DAA|nr:hypothetical protein [Nostoc sp. UHCC 0251]MEA5622977.1 hypothetical protein [Nostoc sp. UHCC 0251]